MGRYGRRREITHEGVEGPDCFQFQDSCPSDPWYRGTFSPRERTGNKDTLRSCLRNRQGGSLLLT